MYRDPRFTGKAKIPKEYPSPHQNDSRSSKVHKVKTMPRETTERTNAKRIFRSELEKKIRSSLPLAQYLDFAYEEYNNREIGKVQTLLWEFIRLAKAHPDLSDRDADAALEKVEQALSSIHEDDVEDIWNALFPDVGTEDDARAEFLDAWLRVLYLPGVTPLDNARERAKHVCYRPQKRSGQQGYVKLITFAGCLQEVMGDHNIFLPCREVGECLNLKAMTISRYRRWAELEGILAIRKAHTFRLGSSNNEATEYRFNFDRVQRQDLDDD
jgi:hypothetical protein